MNKVIGLCCSCHKEMFELEDCYVNNRLYSTDINDFYFTRLVVYDVITFNAARIIYHSKCFQKMLKEKGIKIQN